MPKNAPVWKMLDQPEPPIVNGYWDYGQVWSDADHCPLGRWACLREDLAMGWLSYKMWGRKIRQQQRWNWQRTWRPWLAQRFAAWYVRPLTRQGDRSA